MSNSNNPFCPPASPDVKVIRRGVHPLAVAVLIFALVTAVVVNVLLSTLLAVERDRANSERDRAYMWQQTALTIERYITERTRSRTMYRHVDRSTP